MGGCRERDSHGGNCCLGKDGPDDTFGGKRKRSAMLEEGEGMPERTGREIENRAKAENRNTGTLETLDDSGEGQW